MKSIITTLFLITSLTHSYISCAQEITDLSQQKLSGKVKSLTETSYKVKKEHEKVEQSFYSRIDDVYNTKGNKTLEYTYNPDGTLDAKSVFTYDNNDLLTQEDSYNADGGPAFTNIYKYDKNGNMTSVDLYDAGGSLFLETKSAYDANGNEINETNYSQVEELDRHREKEKLKNIVQNKTLWRYDDKNNMLEEAYYEGDATLTKKTVYTYDSNGNKTAQYKSEDGMTIKTDYQYNNKHNPVVETQHNADGSVALKIVTAYDDKGNDTSESYYDKDNALLTQSLFQFTYDKNNNWNRKVQLDNDKIIMVTVREITYY